MAGPTEQWTTGKSCSRQTASVIIGVKPEIGQVFTNRSTHNLQFTYYLDAFANLFLANISGIFNNARFHRRVELCRLFWLCEFRLMI